MSFVFWIWLAVAILGSTLGVLGSRAPQNAPRFSRVFETVGSESAAPTQSARRDWSALLALGWPLLWGGAGLMLGWLPDGAPGFSFEAHRVAWWSWTAGLSVGAISGVLGGATLGGAARGETRGNWGAAPLGLGGLGALMALFAAVETLRGARIEALFGLAAGWIVARSDDDDSALVAVAAILAGLALWRDTRALGEAWSLTAGMATLTALLLMSGAGFAARPRAWWMLLVALAGAFALHLNGETRAAAVALGGAFCGLLWWWHTRSDGAEVSTDVEAEKNPFPILVALALALGANTVLQGYGVALGALTAGATLWALGERYVMARVMALGAILAIYRLIEARAIDLRAAPFGDFVSLWALGAAATLLLATTAPRVSPGLKPLVTPAATFGLLSLVVLWGPRATAGALAGCLVAVIFGSNNTARAALLGVLGLGAWLELGLEMSETSRAVRLGALLVLALLGALGAALNANGNRKESKTP